MEVPQDKRQKSGEALPEKLYEGEKILYAQ